MSECMMVHSINVDTIIECREVVCLKPILTTLPFSDHLTFLTHSNNCHLKVISVKNGGRENILEREIFCC